MQGLCACYLYTQVHCNAYVPGPLHQLDELHMEHMSAPLCLDGLYLMQRCCHVIVGISLSYVSSSSMRAL